MRVNWFWINCISVCIFFIVRLIGFGYEKVVCFGWRFISSWGRGLGFWVFVGEGSDKENEMLGFFLDYVFYF